MGRIAKELDGFSLYPKERGKLMGLLAGLETEARYNGVAERYCPVTGLRVGVRKGHDRRSYTINGQRHGYDDVKAVLAREIVSTRV